MLTLTKRGWGGLAVLAIVVASVAVGASGCGGDDDDVTAPPKKFIITEEQSGVYDIAVTFEDDEGNPIPEMEHQTDTETVCPGEGFAQDEFGDCNVTVLSSSSFRVRCTEHEEMPGGDCSFSVTQDITLVFETDSFSATGPFTMVVEGTDCLEEFEIIGICNVTGVKTGEVPPGACEKSGLSDLTRLVPGCERVLRGATER